MKGKHNISRRTVFKSSLLGAVALSIPNLVWSRHAPIQKFDFHDTPKNSKYPSIDDEIVAEIVGASHFNFEKVQKMVNHRPELARANWDWSFGDWESALGAASHVGRREIAEFLISKGARPNIFTFAMLGNFKVVKAMIEEMPSLLSTQGPHGISLILHAKAGMRSKDLSQEQIASSEKLIEFLEKQSENLPKPEYLELTEAEKQKFIGDYKYGDGEKDGFTVKFNMRKMLALGKLGKSGGGLLQIAPNEFLYNGVSSVKISFDVVDNAVQSLTVFEPDLILKAMKIN